MKRILLILLCMSLLIVNGCMTKETCKNMLEQYNPPDDCMILIVDDISGRYICKNLQGEEIYNMIKENDFSHFTSNEGS